MNDNAARLDLVEDIYLRMADPTGRRVHAYLAKGRPKKGCTCGRGKHCDDGPPRLADSDGKPYSLRTVYEWVRIVKTRLRSRLDVDREENRALAIGRFDHMFALAAETRKPKEGIAAASRRAELDGTLMAAEEATRPSLYQRVRDLMLSVEDYEPPAEAPETIAPLSPEVARHQLARLERLLLAADEGAARYRQIGEPPQDEAKRLTWRRDILDEAILQTVTSPAVSPEKKRDLIVKAAGTASMITDGAKLVEDVEELKRRLGPT